MREHPKDIGDRSQLAIILALNHAGYRILLPLGETTRYDLVTENDGVLRRVQCKTGRLKNGCVMFRTASSYYHHPHPNMPAKHYRGQIEDFAVYCVETGVVYMVPIDDLSADWHASLRIDATKNNQAERVIWARDYEIGTVAIGGLRAPSGA
jgi:PD-(D/E)XK endonuclease